MRNGPAVVFILMGWFVMFASPHIATYEATLAVLFTGAMLTIALYIDRPHRFRRVRISAPNFEVDITTVTGPPLTIHQLRAAERQRRLT